MTASGKGIALLVPFRDDAATGRLVNWQWLQRYWEESLPDAQIVVGTDYGGNPFSKTCAVNDAFRNSDPTCDIIVMIDADCYIAPEVILQCAADIREARLYDERKWFVPYQNLYRLTQEGTSHLTTADQDDVEHFLRPPTDDDVSSASSSPTGHRYGALIQIFPREAFEMIGGMDPRFRSWGGEDITNVRVLDTLYCIHETTNNAVFTLYHTAYGDVYLRRWAGQSLTGVNDALSLRYRKTRRDPARMQAIIDEWINDPALKKYGISP
jgi:predicted glycosyltransferase involved in capsule biosynthesis